MQTSEIESPSPRSQIRRSALLFGLYILGLFGLLYGLDKQLVDPFTRGIAQLARAILLLGGTEATVHDKVVVTPLFSVAIQNNCNAIYETALFVSAILAYPATWRQRFWGALLGSSMLYILNLMRVLSLIYVGSHFRPYFETAHVYVWQSLFIVFALGLWLFWAGALARHPQS